MMGIVRGIVTLVLFIAFLAMIFWVASGRNRQRFDAAARLPLEDDPLPIAKEERVR